MYLEAIVVCAGSGKRLKSKISKPLVDLLGKPILIRTLKKIELIPPIRKIILVVRENDFVLIKRIIKKSGIKKIKDIVIGGKERFDSVRAGLNCLSKNCDLVLVHDGVRPFVDKRTVVKCIKTANQFGAAIVGVPVKPTIKEIKSKNEKGKEEFLVDKTLDRKKIWEIQTPQIFKKNIILKAYKKSFDKNITDDSALVEKLGVKVRIVKGQYSNIKITTPEDLIIAKAILKNV